MSLVIINDYVTNDRIEVMFNRPQDFVHADAVWENEDPLLQGLQDTVFFKDKTTWSALSPLHYRFLLLQILNKVAALTTEEQSDPANEVMVNLTFCLSLMLKCIEERTEAVVELLHVNRHGDQEILTDFTASYNMQLEPKAKKGFRIIVDNT